MINSADALKHRDVSEDTIEIFKNLYAKGHSPASALNTHKLDMQLQHEKDYVYEAADRANCPDIQFCHRLYRKILVFDKTYGAASGEQMLHDLEAAIESYNSEQGEAWAVCYRHDLLVRGNNTNSYAEAAMRILKDQIFERVRAYNIAQLLDFLVTRLPSYYERRLIDLANGRVDVTVSKRFLPGGSSLPKDDIIKIDGHNYEVRSQSKQDIVYHVDTTIWTCTCTVGMNGGAPCKHQYAVVKNFGESSLNFIPLRDPHQREHLLFIATGEKNVRPGWFTPLPIAGMTTDVNPECMANGGDVEAMQSTSCGTAEMLHQNKVNVRSSSLSDYENEDTTNADVAMAAVVAVVPALKYWHCSGRSGSKELAVQECLYLDSTHTRKLKILDPPVGRRTRLPLLRLLQRLGQRAAWLHHLDPWLNTGREGSTKPETSIRVGTKRRRGAVGSALLDSETAVKEKDAYVLPWPRNCARLVFGRMDDQPGLRRSR
ncbi:hypothetical protein O3P69_012322 [Scylla paramamosain]|uniref:SWIM-type domain-containing protein n=1 Tax=Scylla paramamosain TaxID=85552 RepID=A0AAW0SEA7_SCYPA